MSLVRHILPDRTARRKFEIARETIKLSRPGVTDCAAMKSQGKRPLSSSTAGGMLLFKAREACLQADKKNGVAR
jgi:hypothetical protein